MSHSCVTNYIHVIFCTKKRATPIHPEIENRLYSYIVGIAKNNKTPILKINGTDDHIHILLNLHPSIALATLVKEFKSYSTAWMKKNGYPEFSWQKGYGGFSYCQSLTQNVINYIANQKEHHKKFSLKDELENIKKQWGVTWNWDCENEDQGSDQSP
jgi:REP element-mobilizing transposase RayT